MPNAAPVILLEFNELTPRLMRRFMSEGHLPNFSRLYEQAEVFTTDAEASGEDLNPWVQWVTAHTGLSHTEHGVRHLADTDKLDKPSIWDVASRAGKKVWICGSMNARYEPGLNGFVLPDPWSQNIDPYPRGELDPFYRFVVANVQEHSKPTTAGSRADMLRFGAFMARHGLSLDTVLHTARQLVCERRDSAERYKRASVLDRLQWDVFSHYFRKHRPQLASYFINSTAHFQHNYWRNLEPEQFEIQPTAAEQQRYRDAIRYGYQQMDDLLGRAFELAGGEATIVFCTALSQQPYTLMEKSGGKRHYRLIDGDVVRDALAVEGNYKYEPVMGDEFYLRFDSELSARAAEDRLAGFRVAGEAPLRVIGRDGKDVFGQCRIRRALPQDTLVETTDGRVVGRYYDIFHLVDSLKSGYHHPDGMLWIRAAGRRPRVVEDKVSLRALAPTVLDLLGLPQADFMRESSLLRGEGTHAAAARAR